MSYSIKFATGEVYPRAVSIDNEGTFCHLNGKKVYVREGNPSYGDRTDYVEVQAPPIPKSEAFDPNFWYALEMTSIYTPRGYEAITIICNEKELDQARQVRANPLVARFMRIVRVSKDKVTEVVA